MNKKINKVLNAVVIIGIALFILSIFIIFIGYGLNSENLVYSGIAFIIFGCPACFVLFFVILVISAIIEEKSKKR